jgi:WD40 repeat protein
MKSRNSKFKAVVRLAMPLVVLVVTIVIPPAGHSSSNEVWSQSEVSPTSLNAAILFSPEGQLVATGRAETDNVYIRSAADGTLIRVLNGRDNNADALAFSPDSQLLITGTGGPGDGLSLNLWRVTDGVRLVGRIPAHNNGTIGVSLSPDGQLLATCGFHDPNILLWHVPDMTQLGAINNFDLEFGAALRVKAIAFSPDGQLLATGDGRNIKLRQVSDGAIVRTFAASGALNHITLAFGPDGKKLIAGITSLDPTYGSCVDCSVKLWRVADGRLLRSFRSRAGELKYTKVGFSPDGQTIAAGFVIGNNTSGAIEFWSVDNGRSIFVDNQPSGVHAFAFSPDGRFYGYMLVNGTVAVSESPVIRSSLMKVS